MCLPVRTIWYRREMCLQVTVLEMCLPETTICMRERENVSSSNNNQKKCLLSITLLKMCLLNVFS